MVAAAIVLANGRILTAHNQFIEGSVMVDNGKITQILGKLDVSELGQNITVVELDGKYLVPGFLDVHVHGGNGSDTMDGTVDAINEMARFHASHGTTSFLPTTMTAPLPDIEQALHAVKQAMEQGTEGAEVLGCHMEGPFISVEFKGAQNPEHIHPPSVEVIQSYLDQVGPIIRLMTIAPEQPGAAELITFLSKNGIVAAAGHTNATYADMEAAIEQGVSHIIHCYNGMRGLHHREPGVVGAALVHDEVSAELIADGVHVHPGAMKLVLKAKPEDKVVLISDSIRASGLADGVYDLGGQEVIVHNGICNLKSGNLAGSTLTLDKAVRNAVDLIGLPLELAVQLASYNPACVIGVQDRKGTIAVGKDADLVVMDDDLSVVKTIVGGRIVYEM